MRQTITRPERGGAAVAYSVRWGTEQALTDNTKFQATDPQFVLPGYFETMKVPLLDGRSFTDADNLTERSFMLIDDQMAAKAFQASPPSASAC